jgi:hypothetical protein
MLGLQPDTELLEAFCDTTRRQWSTGKSRPRRWNWRVALLPESLDNCNLAMTVEWRQNLIDAARQTRDLPGTPVHFSRHRPHPD